MADIVQLEEKGNLLYPKTHTSAIDGLDETLVKKTGDEDIAGVKNFTDGLKSQGEIVATKSDYFGLVASGEYVLASSNNKLPLDKGTVLTSNENFCTVNTNDVTVNKSINALVNYSASILWASANGWADVRLYKNDTLISSAAMATNVEGLLLSGSGANIVKLTAGDKLSVRVVMDSNMINKVKGRNPNLTILGIN
ncbi:MULTISPECIES: hypothetical protein [unclassified Enterococcus]|uniref:hypothetical protein n=1 Tax=unclassified Enterococcus TaxID=2608891 RepID=UPI001CE12AFC|nr:MULTISPECIES: hypothetical protein [unclassified Enterococcus]MCA5012416.1 hypothetical protein [Enterococcus sp. S23]MCA5015667.1 hypothetical protein [Enterococcus sp. S22(2020)]